LPIEPTVISDFDVLRSMAPAWMDLLARSSSNEPTLSPAWLLPWWEIFGSSGGRRLRVMAWRDGPRLIGLFPLLLRRHWYAPGIPFRRLEPLGSGEDEEDEICSDYLNVIVERGAEVRVAESLATELARANVGRWDELILPAMDGASPLPPLLERAFWRNGLRTVLEEVNAAPYIPLPSSWDAYLGMLPSSRRYLVTRSQRDFDRWARGAATFSVARTLDELAEGKRVLRSLHAERWAADGRRGAFESNRFSAFHDHAMAELFARGALELSWLSVGAEPVAALYNIVHDRKVFFYQCGRKMTVPKGVRPGIVVQAHAIRRAIDQGLREYDFLPGTQQYKMQLAPVTRPIFRLRAVRAPWLERGRVAVHRASRLFARRAPPAPVQDLGQEAHS
jgi:CelD/BcsL family acetyltransferase involved in cellulose biosynthesis